MALESSSSTSRYRFVSCFSVVCGPTVHSCASGFADTCHPADSSNNSNTYCQVLVRRLLGMWDSTSDIGEYKAKMLDSLSAGGLRCSMTCFILSAHSITTSAKTRASESIHVDVVGVRYRFD